VKYIFWTLLILAISFASFAAGYLLNGNGFEIKTATISKFNIEVEKPLEKYTIENLSVADIIPGDFQIDSPIEEESDEYDSHVFKFHFNPNLDGKTNKTTTGQINFPISLNGQNESSEILTYPIVAMLRGYINQELFRTGDGTRNAASVFAENGFITVAPDFLGYGGSDSESADIFETRFQTYTTVLALLKSLDQIDQWDGENIFIWGHSNGGQIAIITLEVTGANIPTTLWAPVTRQFPYSVLYYTDESDDGGKLIRRELSEFEKLYDTDKYSIPVHIDRIKAPILIHHGLNDDAIPEDWIDDFVYLLEESDKEITLFKYPGTDHNMRPVWDTVVEKDLEFFKSYLD
jgi:dipeptidyl aminopeptidase/acylaminoacyl peptidase